MNTAAVANQNSAQNPMKSKKRTFDDYSKVDEHSIEEILL
jgi:hypothetical protein